jgi:hypothetical protein
MPEPKKGLARIEVPRRTGPAPASPAEAEVGGPALFLSTSHRLMAQAIHPARDPWVTPLAGLLLAFSAVSLIIQLLIAFS